MQIDANLTISAIVAEILEKALERQREMNGTMVRGTVLEHLVGAKLSLALGARNVIHKTVSTADDSSGSAGDFEIAETVIHVTTSPGDSLVNRCQSNLRNGLRPIVVCPSAMKSSAIYLAYVAGLAERIEVFSAEEFISMNLNKLSGFSSKSLAEKLQEFIDKYNELIDTFEKDPSLKIVRSRR